MTNDPNVTAEAACGCIDCACQPCTCEAAKPECGCEPCACTNA
jgi:hypothetical protein